MCFPHRFLASLFPPCLCIYSRTSSLPWLIHALTFLFSFIFSHSSTTVSSFTFAGLFLLPPFSLFCFNAISLPKCQNNLFYIFFPPFVFLSFLPFFPYFSPFSLFFSFLPCLPHLINSFIRPIHSTPATSFHLSFPLCNFGQVTFSFLLLPLLCFFLSFIIFMHNSGHSSLLVQFSHFFPFLLFL